jgi:hypothetical protein
MRVVLAEAASTSEALLRAEKSTTVCIFRKVRLEREAVVFIRLWMLLMIFGVLPYLELYPNMRL